MNHTIAGIYERRIRQYEDRAEFAKAQLVICKTEMPRMVATWRNELKDCKRNIKKLRTYLTQP